MKSNRYGEETETAEEKIRRLQAEGLARFKECERHLPGRRGRPCVESYVEETTTRTESNDASANLPPDEPDESPKLKHRKAAKNAQVVAWPFKPTQSYISIAQAAEFLGVCSKTIKRLQRDGLLNVVQVSGRLHRVELSSLKNFIEQSTL